jgi:predicted transcriptional regulator
MKGENKTLTVNFRISKDRKRQLEYIAKKIGITATQFLDISIRLTIKDLLSEEGDNEAFEHAGIKAGMSPAIAKLIAENRFTPDQYKDVLKDGLYEGIYREYEDTVHNFINARWQEFGIDEKWRKDKRTKVAGTTIFQKTVIKGTIKRIKAEAKAEEAKNDIS